MKHQKITIAGKTFEIAYCYATEIAYRDIAGEDMDAFMPEISQSIQNEHLPDPKKTIYLILAAAMAYATAKDEETPIKDVDLMTEATPMELGSALGTFLTLRSQFYILPSGEPEDKKKGKKGKN